MEVCNISFEKHSKKTDQVSIEIMSEDINLLSKIKKKMESISLSDSICRIPEELSKGNEDKYYPSLVSIGPFHYDKDFLKRMDDQKWRYFNTLLSRKPNTEATIETCIRSLRNIEQKSRNFYGETIEMGSDQFVEMMFLDGCFIIELFIEFSFKNLRRRDDPFFSTAHRIFQIRSDLILLENQLPFFVLDHLFRFVPIPEFCHLSFIELSLCFFKKLIPRDYTKLEYIGSERLHFLDLIWQHYLPTVPAHPTRGGGGGGGQAELPPVAQLCGGGIRVVKAISDSPSDITFVNGDLNVACFEVHGYTEILFRNLIALENCRRGCLKYVTSYVFLMGKLIRSRRDVRLFLDKGILVDGYDREREIVLLFKRLSLDVNVKEFYYRGLCEEINEYGIGRKKGGWEKIRDVYDRTHFGIAGFSLFLVFLVLLFTGGLIAGVSLLLHHFQ